MAFFVDVTPLPHDPYVPTEASKDFPRTTTGFPSSAKIENILPSHSKSMFICDRLLLLR